VLGRKAGWQNRGRRGPYGLGACGGRSHPSAAYAAYGPVRGGGAKHSSEDLSVISRISRGLTAN